ncbi:MAG: ribosome small subunit-dependent GTPase A [Myxococcales bacterium]|nr:ribosome small subunit-dependent GTPase A [Myxococcales bacterium]
MSFSNDSSPPQRAISASTPLSIEALGFDASFAYAFETETADATVPVHPGRVIRADRGRVVVHDGTEPVSLPLTGRFIHDPPIVGDFVAVETDTGRIRGVVARRQLLARRRAGSDVQQQGLAANVDIVWLACAADRLNLSWFERGIRLVRDADAIPILIITKADLLAGRDIHTELFRRHIYEDVHLTSVLPPEDDGAANADINTGPNTKGIISLLQQLPAGKTAVLLGPSGAGKSTLLNALLGEGAVATGPVRHGDAKGRHTTVRRELHVLPTGGLLVDTPGTRELGFFRSDDVNGTGFDDIDALAEQCRFRDCSHLEQADCAVLAAVASGKLPQARYDSFQRQQRERRHLEEVAATTDHARRERGRGFARMVKDAKRIKGFKRR